MYVLTDFFSGSSGVNSNRVKIISLDVLKQKVSVKEELNDVANSLVYKTSIKKPVVISKKPTKEGETGGCFKKHNNVVINNTLSPRERMEQFLKMKAPDLPKPKNKELACEKPLKTPKDTLRCPACNKLYARINNEDHKKECKMKAEHKYGCVLCQYKHTDIQELQKHISTCHKRKKIIP